jgi:hypothetical protein
MRTQPRRGLRGAFLRFTPLWGLPLFPVTAGVILAERRREVNGTGRFPAPGSVSVFLQSVLLPFLRSTWSWRRSGFRRAGAHFQHRRPQAGCVDNRSVAPPCGKTEPWQD